MESEEINQEFNRKWRIPLVIVFAALFINYIAYPFLGVGYYERIAGVNSQMIQVANILSIDVGWDIQSIIFLFIIGYNFVVFYNFSRRDCREKTNIVAAVSLFISLVLLVIGTLDDNKQTGIAVFVVFSTILPVIVAFSIAVSPACDCKRERCGKYFHLLFVAYASTSVITALFLNPTTGLMTISIPVMFFLLTLAKEIMLSAIGQKQVTEKFKELSNWLDGE